MTRPSTAPTIYLAEACPEKKERSPESGKARPVYATTVQRVQFNVRGTPVVIENMRQRNTFS